jgi:hypothetical protein
VLDSRNLPLVSPTRARVSQHARAVSEREVEPHLCFTPAASGLGARKLLRMIAGQKKQ